MGTNFNTVQTITLFQFMQRPFIVLHDRAGDDHLPLKISVIWHSRYPSKPES